jgi:glyoxylase-like metal-dependent hydrolase (beta-lactamase superfamily II)
VNVPDPITGALGPWTGGQVGDRATCVLAPNPGPMTLDGTNTWVLSEPGSAQAVVIDPGPLMQTHLDAVIASAEATGARITRILLTHGHEDHAEGARELAQRTGAPVQALDPAHRLGGEGLADGDVVDVDGLVIEVIGTPGHTSDSLSFLLHADRALLTGDTLLGRGTTVVMHPDGRVGDYLASLQRLHTLADEGLAVVLPGHGPVLDDPLRVVKAYEAHRRSRLDEVAHALRDLEAQGSSGGDGSVDDDIVMRIVRRVYADVPEHIWPAAALSVAAQVEYLRSN